MDNLNFSNPRIEYTGIYPNLVVDVDGQAVKIGLEQKAMEHGLLFVGLDLTTKYLPADPDQGRPRPEPLAGFTDDPRLFRLWELFRGQADAGPVDAGPLPMPPE